MFKKGICLNISNPNLLSGKVEKAPNKSLGFDADSVIHPQAAQVFYSKGFKFALRYLSLNEEQLGDLTNLEANDILNAGLALMPVQHVPEPGWFPSDELGKLYGQNAASQVVGFLRGEGKILL